MIAFNGKRFGTLSILSALLLFSAGFRVLGISGSAFALESLEAAQAVKKDLSINTESRDLDALLKSFSAREAVIVEEETKLSARLELLSKTKIQVQNKIQELEEREARLRELLAIADAAAEDDVARLTTVYENMKPKAAAIVFEEMTPAFAAGFLARMTPAAAAAILANLKAESAYAISVVFAGRHAEKVAN